MADVMAAAAVVPVVAPRLHTPRTHPQLGAFPAHALHALRALRAHDFLQYQSASLLALASLPAQTLAPMPSQTLTAAQGLARQGLAQ